VVRPCQRGRIGSNYRFLLNDADLLHLEKALCAGSYIGQGIVRPFKGLAK
jgi:hypothetical protein